MARLKELPTTELRIGLFDPGLTPMLRAGLGGLATALESIGSNALSGTGTAEVDATYVTLRWPEVGGAAALLERLFTSTFRITQGLFDLPGYFEREPPLEVRVATTDALRLTFLQHGKSATKSGAPSVQAFEIDDRPHQVLVQHYQRFVHQDAWREIAKRLDSGAPKPLELAAWANPGAVERHVGLGSTNIEYSPGEALCACFAIIGCISLQGPNRTGVLIIPEPDDLLRFSEARPLLAPRKLRDCIVASPGDGVLAIHAALRTSTLRKLADGVAGISATSLRTTAWAKQLKSRTDALIADRYDDATLNAFDKLVKRCPTRVVPTKGKKKGEPGGYWGIPSSLRGFVSNNLANKRPFYSGFATAKTRDDPPRWMHRFHSKNDNLGALRFPEDQKGLVAMAETLSDSERRFVDSIHTAIRQRFGAIAQENASNMTAFKKRCQGEREKWRLAFSGARTHEQIRNALADLWSRAGSIRELRGDGWHALQPLLGAAQWEAARDLALIALASYQGKEADETESNDEDT